MLKNYNLKCVEYAKRYISNDSYINKKTVVITIVRFNHRERILRLCTWVAVCGHVPELPIQSAVCVLVGRVPVISQNSQQTKNVLFKFWVTRRIVLMIPLNWKYYKSLYKILFYLHVGIGEKKRKIFLILINRNNLSLLCRKKNSFNVEC